MPLYDGGVTASQSRAAEGVVDLRQGQLEVARRKAAADALAAWVKLGSLSDARATYEQRVADAKVALLGTSTLWAGGERTLLDLLNAQEALLQAQLSLAETRHDYLVERYTVASAIGTLTANTLRLKVTPYDPDSNFEAVKDKWWGLDTPRD
jgi:outer membrane protein